MYPKGYLYSTDITRQTLEADEQIAYSTAINCLASKPSQLDQTNYPGAINRYMDFAVIHINRTLEMHIDGFFNTWHRMFVHLFEQELKTQCGYTGVHPYWNWVETQEMGLVNSKMFDGSATSMSGDGSYNASAGPVVLGPNLTVPNGNGGGPIVSGPFVKWQVSMNNVPISTITSGTGLPADTFDLNQRPLTRDLNQYIADTWSTQAALDNLLACLDADCFELYMSGVPGSSSLGMHSSGHFITGGIGADFFASPQDPFFFLHHAEVDRIFTTWQGMHPDAALGLSGTETCLNIPPSPNATLTSWEPDWGYLFPSVQVGELMSTSAGPFCYTYDTLVQPQSSTPAPSGDPTWKRKAGSA
jgi:tyrosinase